MKEKTLLTIESLNIYYTLLPIELELLKMIKHNLFVVY